MLFVSEELKNAYQGGYIGILVLSNAKKYDGCEKLKDEKKQLEEELRKRFRGCDRAGLTLLEPIKSYVDYYKRFKKTYHVLLQLESITLKNKSIPNVSPLVEIMFMAELKNQLLTAGHDLDKISLPLRAELARGTERYQTLNGQEKELAAGDMMIADKQGIISSIIYGPDQKTPITKDTERVVFTVYAPPGIGRSLLLEHFQDIKGYALLLSPEIKVDFAEIYSI